MSLINDFLSLIYPRRCEACETILFGHESFVCNYCQLNLPKSNYHLRLDSELSRVFDGRVPLTNAMSYYLYEKSGKVQNLLQAIKYQGQKELASHIGSLYGNELAQTGFSDKIDFIVPIPLHKNKLRARGYNQSEWFANGLSKQLSKPVEIKFLERKQDTSTQTKKNKYERWENVEGIFNCPYPDELKYKHILLVDDVITTGATIEAAHHAFKSIEGVSLSVASIAFAARLS